VNGAKPGPTPFTRDSDVIIGSIVSGNLVVPVLEGEPGTRRQSPAANNWGQIIGATVQCPERFACARKSYTAGVLSTRYRNG